MSYEPGIRVGAGNYTKKNGFELIGFGVYEGDFVPPTVNLEEAKKVEAMSKEDRGKCSGSQLLNYYIYIRKNPRIKLDNGKTVWGYECWWGPEEKVKEFLAKNDGP